jgi:hypothetical protein
MMANYQLGRSLSNFERCEAVTSDFPIIRIARTDPIPENAIGMILAERAVVEPHPGRPNASHFLETDGRMPGVGFENLKTFVGEIPRRFRQPAVMMPKLG